MAGDGLVFRCFSRVNTRFDSPLRATIFSGLLAALLATFFDVTSLADMMSIGTLNAYSLVSLCVLILRYHADFVPADCSFTDELTGQTCSVRRVCSTESPVEMSLDSLDSSHKINSCVGWRPKGDTPTLSISPVSYECHWAAMQTHVTLAPNKVVLRRHLSFTQQSLLTQMFNLENEHTPTPASSRLSKWLITITVALVLAMNVILVVFEEAVFDLNAYVLAVILVLVLAIITGLAAIARQPKSEAYLSFECPAVPLIPILSIQANTYMALSLSGLTWLRFLIWFAIGCAVYAAYGVRHSTEYTRAKLAERYRLRKVDQSLTIPS